MKIFLVLCVVGVFFLEISSATYLRDKKQGESFLSSEYEALFRQYHPNRRNVSEGSLEGNHHIKKANEESWEGFASKCAGVIHGLISTLTNVVSSKPGDATDLQFNIRNRIYHHDNRKLNCSKPAGFFPESEIVPTNEQSVSPSVAEDEVVHHPQGEYQEEYSTYPSAPLPDFHSADYGITNTVHPDISAMNQADVPSHLLEPIDYTPGIESVIPIIPETATENPEIITDSYHVTDSSYPSEIYPTPEPTMNTPATFAIVSEYNTPTSPIYEPHSIPQSEYTTEKSPNPFFNHDEDIYQPVQATYVPQEQVAIEAPEDPFHSLYPGTSSTIDIPKTPVEDDCAPESDNAVIDQGFQPSDPHPVSDYLVQVPKISANDECTPESDSAVVVQGFQPSDTYPVSDNLVQVPKISVDDECAPESDSAVLPVSAPIHDNHTPGNDGSVVVAPVPVDDECASDNDGSVVVAPVPVDEGCAPESDGVVLPASAPVHDNHTPGNDGSVVIVPAPANDDCVPESDSAVLPASADDECTPDSDSAVVVQGFQPSDTYPVSDSLVQVPKISEDDECGSDNDGSVVVAPVPVDEGCAPESDGAVLPASAPVHDNHTPGNDGSVVIVPAPANDDCVPESDSAVLPTSADDECTPDSDSAGFQPSDTYPVSDSLVQVPKISEDDECGSDNDGSVVEAPVPVDDECATENMSSSPSSSDSARDVPEVENKYGESQNVLPNVSGWSTVPAMAAQSAPAHAHQDLTLNMGPEYVHPETVRDMEGETSHKLPEIALDGSLEPTSQDTSAMEFHQHANAPSKFYTTEPETVYEPAAETILVSTPPPSSAIYIPISDYQPNVLPESDSDESCPWDECCYEDIDDHNAFCKAACKDLESAREELKNIFEKIKKKLKCVRKN